MPRGADTYASCADLCPDLWPGGDPGLLAADDGLRGPALPGQQETGGKAASALSRDGGFILLRQRMLGQDYVLDCLGHLSPSFA